jgi:integrase
MTINPTSQADPPAQPAPDPHPPTPDEAARIINAAWVDPDWGTLVWLAMTTGARRGELCALRWHHFDLTNGVLTLRRSVYVDDDGELAEKDTKTHQQRRVALDPETLDVIRDHYARWLELAADLDIGPDPAAYVFSPEPDRDRPFRPDSITQRYGRLAARLGIDTTIHALRHYTATELINAGVDVRTVAGRLGHGGGGTTTLRVYAAWLSESDQRAATTLSARMPARPTIPTQRQRQPSPYEEIAAALRAEISRGVLRPGDCMPTVVELAKRFQVGTSTAHRAIAELRAAGEVEVSRGRRATVAPICGRHDALA